jgi:hypothetical protein
VTATCRSSTRADGFDRGVWKYKNKREQENLPAAAALRPERGNDIGRDIAPLPHEFVTEKHELSPFVGTPLLGF